MQVAFFWCFRQGVAGISRDLGRDIPDLEKLYASKLWAYFSFPKKSIAIAANIITRNTFQQKCFGTINFVNIAKQSLYKANSFACSLANRDKPVAATLQRKCFGGIIFVIISVPRMQGLMNFFHVGSRPFLEWLRELLRELWSSYCSSREMPFQEWDFSTRELFSELRELLPECPGTLPELREWPSHSESVFPDIGVVTCCFPHLLVVNKTCVFDRVKLIETDSNWLRLIENDRKSIEIDWKPTRIWGKPIEIAGNLLRRFRMEGGVKKHLRVVPRLLIITKIITKIKVARYYFVITSARMVKCPKWPFSD